MYNERTNFSIKNVIIQFLFITLIIFILIWLFPLKSDFKNLKTTGENSVDLSVKLPYFWYLGCADAKHTFFQK